MGMYTEFAFRASIKDGPVADWLEQQIVGGEWFDNGGFDSHPFFDVEQWDNVFRGGGAVYQLSLEAIFQRPNTFGPYRNQLVLSSSLKNYGDPIAKFINWVTPHLDMYDGDFLGYSLYEDSTDDGDRYREHPTLYFHNRDAVWRA